MNHIIDTFPWSSDKHSSFYNPSNKTRPLDDSGFVLSRTSLARLGASIRLLIVYLTLASPDMGMASGTNSA
jgi:hypothetical protein